MGLSIGNILSDIGVNLPKIDLGSIGKTVLDEGKKLLGDVVKDSFTLSNKPGETFADSMNLNVLGDNIRLPNPIGSLANKLLGGVDNKLNQYGVNVDFKQVLGSLFHLPTEAGDTTTVPPVKQRLAPQASGAGGVGGGATVTANAATGGGVNAMGGGTATPTSEGANPLGSVSASSSGVDPMFNGAIAMQTQAGNLMNTAMTDIQSSDPATQAKGEAEMQMASQQMQRSNEMFSMISQMLQDEHQTRMLIIQNMK